MTNLFVIVAIVCVSIYSSQRLKWIGRDNAHLEAKEYFVSGQVLNGFRGVLTTIFHPEMPFLLPLNWLQQKIFNQGLANLPANDGEKDVWYNSWFIYHYSKMNRRPLAVKGYEPSRAMIFQMDEVWTCLQGMATKPFVDHQMEEEHYYRDFVSLAITYSLGNGWYSGKNVGSKNRLAKSREHVLRAKKLSEWLWELRHKWTQSRKTIEFLAKKPKLTVMMQFVLAYQLEDVIQGQIHMKEFTCDGEPAKRYQIIREEFSSRGGVPAFMQMKDRSQALRLYNATINKMGPRSIKYILEHYCGLVIAGDEDNSYWESFGRSRGVSAAQQAEEDVKGNYQEEIEIMEEGGHGR